MLKWLLLLFIGVPILELYLLFQVGAVIGVLPTVGIVVLTGIIGSWLARREGRKTLTQIQQRLQSGAIPSDELIDGLMILVAGALLITPGVLTDAVGFLGLIPFTRSLLRNRIKDWFRTLTEQGSVEFHYFGSFGDGPENPRNNRQRKRSEDGVDYDIDVESSSNDANHANDDDEHQADQLED
jgi:UPF0716 protein FxsA